MDKGELLIGLPIFVVCLLLLLGLHDIPAEIYVGNSGFDPNVTNIYPSKVTWTNNDSQIHRIVSDDGLFDSGNLSPGENYTYDFSYHKNRIYKYHDSTNTSLKGTIQIEMGPGPY